MWLDQTHLTLLQGQSPEKEADQSPQDAQEARSFVKPETKTSIKLKLKLSLLIYSLSYKKNKLKEYIFTNNSRNLRFGCSRCLMS